MSTTHPHAAVSTAEVEQAIEDYLVTHPFTSRFKAQYIADEIGPNISASEVKHALVDLKEQGDLKKLGRTAGTVTYRATPDGKFGDLDRNQDQWEVL